LYCEHGGGSKLLEALKIPRHLLTTVRSQLSYRPTHERNPTAPLFINMMFTADLRIANATLFQLSRESLAISDKSIAQPI